MKRGQLQLSFGMIFSIIIIIAIMATAFYIISYFLNLSKCTQIGLFYKDLETDVNKAWAADIAQETFTGALPSGIKSVCFGDLETNAGEFSAEQEDLKRYYRRTTNNIFLYPTSKACSRESAAYDMKRAKTDSFFCVETDEGRLSVKLIKNSLDALVTINP